jgi:hypothetical protein
MPTTFEILEKAPESLIAAGVRSAFVPRNRAVIAADCRHGSVTTVLEPAPEPAMDACCLWCNRTFTPRMTGGSTQKFCCTGHRQQFWIAARRWDDAGDRGGPTLGRLPKGVSYERARCLKGIPRPGIPRWLSAFGRVQMRNLGASGRLPTRSERKRVRPVLSSRSSNSKHKLRDRSQR